MDVKIKTALISVSDKSGVVEFAKKLSGMGVKIISTGGTAKKLGEAGLRDNAEHKAAMDEHSIEPIDLVCVNLYPFEATIAKPGCTLEDAIENIDIGGPSMLRSASKNNKFVTVVTQADQYDRIIEEMEKNNGAVSGERQGQSGIPGARLDCIGEGVVAALRRESSSKCGVL